jgi:excisionase family DNA binding protein
MDKQLFTVEAAAEYLKTLGVVSATKNTIRSLIASKRLKPIPIGRRFFIARQELDRLAAGTRADRVA